jgi:hypothetical protein
MSEIPPIIPTQIISSYARTTMEGENVVRTDVQHKKVNGVETVVSSSYTLYNKNAEMVTSPKQTGSNVDIMV